MESEDHYDYGILLIEDNTPMCPIFRRHIKWITALRFATPAHTAHANPTAAQVSERA
jgi:hypothetical protein